MLKLILSGALVFSVTTAAWAQSPGLSGQQITELVAGTTVEIDTPAGTKLPVRYTQEGRLSGEARDLAWFLGSPTDLGRWWVAGDQLCHKWIRWFNGEPQCMRLSKEGSTIRWRSQDGNTGTAAIAVPAPVQAAALLALPRVFPKRTPQVAPPEAPPALATPPRLQEPAEAIAAAPAAASPPAADETVAAANPAAPPAARPLMPAVMNPTPPQAESKQAETRTASAPPRQACGAGSSGSAGRTQARRRSPVPGRQRAQRRRPQHPQRPVGRLRRRRRVAARHARHRGHERLPRQVVSGAAPRDQRLGQQRLSRARGAGPRRLARPRCTMARKVRPWPSASPPTRRAPA